MPDADPKTFRSLYDKEAKGRDHIYGRMGQIAGRDNAAVFIGQTRVTGLGLEKTRIFQGFYVTDGASVYYRDGNLIKDADPAAFVRIIGRYARDGKNLYYGAALIPEADLASLNYITEKPMSGGPGVMADHLGSFRSVDSSRKDADYLKDANHVYFKGAAVPGADPATFRVLHVQGDQWRLAYAEDKNGYYFNGKPLPDTVDRTGERIAPGTLRLLQADREFGWAEIFYSGPSLYAFNTRTEKLELFFTRTTSAPFVRITRGVYADDRNVYFSAQAEKRRSGKSGRHLTGRCVYLQPLHDVTPEDFVKIGEIKGPSSRQEGEIFEANGVRYFHPRYAQGGASLVVMEDGFSPERMRSNTAATPGLERIPLQDEFSHVTDYRSAIQRNAGWLLPLSMAVIILISVLGQHWWRSRRRKSAA